MSRISSSGDYRSNPSVACRKWYFIRILASVPISSSTTSMRSAMTGGLLPLLRAPSSNCMASAWNWSENRGHWNENDIFSVISCSKLPRLVHIRACAWGILSSPSVVIVLLVNYGETRPSSFDSYSCHVTSTSLESRPIAYKQVFRRGLVKPSVFGSEWLGGEVKISTLSSWALKAIIYYIVVQNPSIGW